jgi:ribosomal protein S19
VKNKETRATVPKQIQKQSQENAENKPATIKTNTYQLRSLNLLKMLGHHVHVQEGSNYSYPQPMHLTTL